MRKIKMLVFEWGKKITFNKGRGEKVFEAINPGQYRVIHVFVLALRVLILIFVSLYKYFQIVHPF